MSIIRVVRYKVFPVTLYRIQNSTTVRLRDFEVQTKLKRTSYDVKLHNDLVHPTTKDTYEGPNGMSLRPDGVNFANLVRQFHGNPLIFTFLGGTVVPDNFILLHEFADHFSLQVSRPMPLSEVNERLTEFLKQQPVMKPEDYLKGLDDEHNFDN